CTVCRISAGMTAMTCSRVTPAFTVMMTITPAVVGEVACAWAKDGSAIEATPIRVRVSPRPRLRIAFIGLVAPVTAVTFVLRDSRDVANWARRRRRNWFASQIYDHFPRSTIRDNVDGL